MSFVADLLTVVLVAICLFLILLVLVQLPKKDAGAGIAFGAGAADALFGAGQGNALTKMTKYAAIAFLVLSLLLGLLENKLRPTSSGADFTKMVESRQQQEQMAQPTPTAQTKPPGTAPAAGNNLISTLMSASNAPAPAPTAPPKAPAGTNSPK